MDKKAIYLKAIVYIIVTISILAFIIYKIAYYIGVYEAQNTAISTI